MGDWLAGDWENCWTNACDLEKNTKNQRIKIRRSRRKQDSKVSEEEKFWARVKNLVNKGELRKVMIMVDSYGVSELTDEFLDQVKRMHPKEETK